MLTVVLDSSVYVSALLVTNGVPARIYRAWRDRRFLVATSIEQLEEVAHTLSYPRIRRRYPITDKVVDELLAVLRSDALIVPGVRVIEERLRDPNDAFLLAISAEANAEILVSSDGDLLVLERFGATRIMTPRSFLDLIDLPLAEK
ncbi:MAG TPA: putative toxin-antitoxin system toxin component, PIN family [Longimicrobiaceae bacterium]|nr:putative toxin-antitoxin system toxin component, PIN family [Longimicrobiaceae bacterium]